LYPFIVVEVNILINDLFDLIECWISDPANCFFFERSEEVFHWSIVLWDTVNWKELNSFASNITSYAFSPIGTLLAAGSPDGSVTLWGVLP